jgi:proteic killer suppression protein
MSFRLQEFKAADSLEDLRNLPQARCHELKGNYKNIFSVDLDQPYRLLFRADHDPLPVNSQGGINWSEVKAVIILRIENTHDK